MPRLNGALIILEDNFYIVMKGSSYNRSANDCRTRIRFVPDCVQAEDTGDVEIIRNLKRGSWVDVGNPINSIS